MRSRFPEYSNSVFINCPFDDDYKSLFHAMVFAIQACGFTPRCAKEDSGTDDIRIQKIIEIMRGCQLGIHDLSRTESNAAGLPRFNMPLELGLFMGSRNFGDKEQKSKRYLVLDSEDFRFKAYISDLSGQDIQAHGNNVEGIISAIRAWLSHRTTRKMPHGSVIFNRYRRFLEILPELCIKMDWTVDELQFLEFTGLAKEWLNLE